MLGRAGQGARWPKSARFRRIDRAVEVATGQTKKSCAKDGIGNSAGIPCSLFEKPGPLDASNLIMPLGILVSPSDRGCSKPCIHYKPPREGGLTSDSLVYRYDPKNANDDFLGEEGSFNMCSFWLVEALTRAGRFDQKRLDKARLVFEQMLGYANHLGLYAEETGPRGGTGQFPQAFTHLALISAAFNLDRALDSR